MILSPTSPAPFLSVSTMFQCLLSRKQQSPLLLVKAASRHGLSINTETEQEEQNWAVKKDPLKRDACYQGGGLCTHCFGAG